MSNTAKNVFINTYLNTEKLTRKLRYCVLIQIVENMFKFLNKSNHSSNIKK